MVYARITLSDYANKVLNVVKGKFGLQDKSEAINRFIEMYGEDLVEKEANDTYIKKVLEMEKEHLRKHGNRKMSLRQLDALIQ